MPRKSVTPRAAPRAPGKRTPRTPMVSLVEVRRVLKMAWLSYDNFRGGKMEDAPLGAYLLGALSTVPRRPRRGK